MLNVTTETESINRFFLVFEHTKQVEPCAIYSMHWLSVRCLLHVSLPNQWTPVVEFLVSTFSIQQQ